MFTLPAGPPASMRAADGYLEVRGGASGVRVVSGAGGPNSALVQFSDEDLAVDETVLLVRSRSAHALPVGATVAAILSSRLVPRQLWGSSADSRLL